MRAAFNFFFFGVLLIPVLPVLYWQGRRVRKNVPRLGEADEPAGKVESRKSDRKLHVLMLGESTFAGVGVDRHENGIAGALSACLAKNFEATVEWQVVARNGYTVQKVRKKLLPEYCGKVPDIVIVGVGGNDAFKLNSPIFWQRGIRKLIRDLHRRFPSAPILFAAMPPIRDFPAFPPLMQSIIGGLAEMMGRVLEKEVQRHPNVYFQQPRVVVKDWLSESDSILSVNEFFSDGVHPAPLAYKLWGESLGKFITEEKLLRA